eukprot:TRINITY_DN3420_c0_g1_i1.p1 TRINITY_DN3420_c0_g1~~TRINITY_DN3420_c0_g1_i1.p1  ORF type:complete len:377 (-),score=46.60 TRINITY_DN3420_c0_g1_i1:174-1304(-)
MASATLPQLPPLSSLTPVMATAALPPLSPTARPSAKAGAKILCELIGRGSAGQMTKPSPAVESTPRVSRSPIPQTLTTPAALPYSSSTNGPSSNRRFRCPVPDCRSSFSRNHNLKVHLQTKHADLDPKTTYAAYFRRRKSNTKNKIIPCLFPSCTKAFSMRNNMLQHFRKIHGDLESASQAPMREPHPNSMLSKAPTQPHLPFGTYFSPYSARRQSGQALSSDTSESDDTTSSVPSRPLHPNATVLSSLPALGPHPIMPPYHPHPALGLHYPQHQHTTAAQHPQHLRREMDSMVYPYPQPMQLPVPGESQPAMVPAPQPYMSLPPHHQQISLAPLSALPHQHYPHPFPPNYPQHFGQEASRLHYPYQHQQSLPPRR